MRTQDKVDKVFVTCGVRVAFLLGRIGMRIPKARQKIVKRMKEMVFTEDEEDFMEELFSKKMLKIVIKQIMIDRGKVVRLSKPVPNLKLYRLEDEKHFGGNGGDVSVVSSDAGSMVTETTISSISRKNIPLVLNFGSCS